MKQNALQILFQTAKLVIIKKIGKCSGAIYLETSFWGASRASSNAGYITVSLSIGQ